ncbi:DNA polymerase III subunit delta' [Peribacillus alkalitolerans]|uniref:DNA polymerase III subunit delta' n=1 Tax=Peribacillus alkalitolerans TaxID=1550385 RepID=UPI0013D448F9|nr:DNA polymerase III subunit delta' [Peribacillus alkalitolerans]
MVKQWNELKQVQPEVLTMLENSIKKHRISHAYLFEGERGTGKKDIGIAFAKSLFCLDPTEGVIPCEVCSNCKRISNGNHPDVHMIEPDGLSIKKEQIHHLQGEFNKKSVESKRKVYLVVHADKMTVQAANSLLKFLEEPHEGTTAILLTEQIHRMIPTILSRCQVITLKPLSPMHIRVKLEDQGISSQTSYIISQITHNFEEALQISSDEWFAQAQKIVLKLYEVLQPDSLKALIYLQEEWMGHFKEKEQLDRGLDLLLLIYKDLLYIQLDKPELVVYQSMIGNFEKTAWLLSQKKLAEKMEAILEAKRRLMSNTNPQLVMEQLVLNLQEGSSFV